jgi:hypothetical protein
MEKEYSSAPEDAAAEIREVVRHAGVVEGVHGGREGVVAPVDDQQVAQWRAEERRVVARPAAQPILHDAAQRPARPVARSGRC